MPAASITHHSYRYGDQRLKQSSLIFPVFVQFHYLQQKQYNGPCSTLDGTKRFKFLYYFFKISFIIDSHRTPPLPK